MEVVGTLTARSPSNPHDTRHVLIEASYGRGGRRKIVVDLPVELRTEWSRLSE